MRALSTWATAAALGVAFFLAVPSTAVTDTDTQANQPSCRQVRDAVTLTYRVRREWTSAGQRLWLVLKIENRLGRGVYGETGGALAVTGPAPRKQRAILWGASSADGFEVRRHSTTRKAIYNVVGDKLRASRNAKLALLGVSTNLVFVDHAGRFSGCRLPARIRAPRCLDPRHPEGSWFLTVKKGQRLANLGHRRYSG
jgi:hypothetical protein